MDSSTDLGARPDRDFPGASEQEDSLLRHVVFTGTVWFCGAIVAALLPLAGLLSDGWRPRDLPGGAEGVWWTGVAAAFAGVLLVAWAGCPVVSAAPGTAAARKSLAIRAGVALLLAGFAVATTTVLVA